MKKPIFNSINILILTIFFSVFAFTNCHKDTNPIVYDQGIFPENAINMESINTQYDDYNVGMYMLSGSFPIIFSSNRQSQGGQFDLEQATFSFSFDQVNGSFVLTSAMSNDPFLSKLITAAKTAGNDYGPYRLFSSADGFDYLVLTSVNPSGNLDLYYLRNRPTNTSALPNVEGPYPVKQFNTTSDDGYLSFDSNQDSAYFNSNKDGNFDIYVSKRPAGKDITSWFNMDYAASSLTYSVNSPGDDKCPLIFRKVMVFASNRPGGLGGYDIYYSVFRKGKWSSPVNMGPSVNSEADEFRPVVAYHPDFRNLFMIFSSSRTGGKGGFDLYFKGVEFPE